MLRTKLTTVVLFLAWAVLAEGRTWNIFDTDDRVPLTSRDYPWKTIGYLATGCTGTLVGRDLMLTAAHCVLDGETGKISPNLTYFYPNLIDYFSPTKAWISHVWWGTSTPTANRAADWAIVRLKEPLGDTYGWMGVDAGQYDHVHLPGYSMDYKGGQTAGVHMNCTIRSRADGLLYHDCDNTRGASGAPMFIMDGNKAFIVAINVAEFRDGGEDSLHLPQYDSDHANVAIPASAFVAELQRLKQ